MSLLNTFSGSHSHVNARAGHLHAVRNAIAQVELQGRTEQQESTAEEGFVDVVSRQLRTASTAFAPVARRAKAVPFGKRLSDDDYEGPISLDQDEFSVRPTRVRRQQQSAGAQPPQESPPTGGSNPPAQNVWSNGDIGIVQALYADGTSKNLMVANVVYAIQGSEDGSAEKAVPLQARIVTADGGDIISGTLFALEDYLDAYQADESDPKPFIGVTQSQNVGVPFWTGPVIDVANIWSIDTQTGELTATYQNSVLQWGTNDNTAAYPGSIYSGNGDADAWPATGTIDALHTPMRLRLVKVQ